MESFKIKTKSGEIHVRDSKEGIPLVAVHGALSSSASFGSLLKKPGKQRTIAFDLPGHGESIPQRGFSVGWESYSKVLSDVADAMDLNEFNLIGHSMGGGIAALFAAKNPGRVKRLVLVDSVTRSFKLPLKGRIPQIPLLGDFVFKKIYSMDLFFDYFRHDIFHNADRMDEQRVMEYYLAFDRNRDSVLKAVRLSARPSPVVKKLGEVVCPTLVLWGENDPLIPLSAGADTHRVLKSSKFEVINDCGHSPLEECPKKSVEKILRYLENSTP